MSYKVRLRQCVKNSEKIVASAVPRRPPRDAARRGRTRRPANAMEPMEPIHSRMPLILSPAHFDAWLSSDELPVELLAVPETPEFEAVPVSSWVNSPSHDDARCMEPVPETK